jgi:hypothetical protein
VSDEDTTYPIDFRTFMVEDADSPLPPFPQLPNDEPAFLPDQPVSGSGKWAAVQTAWSNPAMGANAPNCLVTLWSSVGETDLGWDATASGLLSDKLPADLIANLDSYYLWAPFVSPSDQTSD